MYDRYKYNICIGYSCLKPSKRPQPPDSRRPHVDLTYPCLVRIYVLIRTIGYGTEVRNVSPNVDLDRSKYPCEVGTQIQISICESNDVPCAKSPTEPVMLCINV